MSFSSFFEVNQWCTSLESQQRLEFVGQGGIRARDEGWICLERGLRRQEEEQGQSISRGEMVVVVVVTVVVRVVVEVVVRVVVEVVVRVVVEVAIMVVVVVVVMVVVVAVKLIVVEV